MVGGRVRAWPTVHVLPCPDCQRPLKNEESYFQAEGMISDSWAWCCIDCARKRGLLW